MGIGKTSRILVPGIALEYARGATQGNEQITVAHSLAVIVIADGAVRKWMRW